MYKPLTDLLWALRLLIGGICFCWSHLFALFLLILKIIAFNSGMCWKITLPIRDVTSDPTGLVRTWRYPHKIFCNVYIRAAQLIVKNCACDLDSNTHAIIFLNDNDSAMSIMTVSHRECQWSVRSTFVRCPMLMNQKIGHHYASDVNAVIHWYGRLQNMCCSSSTDTIDVKQVLKTFKSAFMLLLIQKENTGIKMYSLGLNTYCLQ